MGNYNLRIKASAEKELEGLPRKDRLRVVGRILGLSENPRPSGSEKLTGSERYRIRQGDYRILYEIYESEIVVVVVKVGHRREVYR